MTVSVVRLPPVPLCSVVGVICCLCEVKPICFWGKIVYTLINFGLLHCTILRLSIKRKFFGITVQKHLQDYQ